MPFAKSLYSVSTIKSLMDSILGVLRLFVKMIMARTSIRNIFVFNVFKITFLPSFNLTIDPLHRKGKMRFVMLIFCKILHKEIESKFLCIYKNVDSIHILNFVLYCLNKYTK